MTRSRQVALRHKVQVSEVMSQLPLHSVICRTAQFGAVLPGIPFMILPRPMDAQIVTFYF